MTTAALAHPVLVPVPIKTLADRVLESDLIVLAREDPQHAFHYAAIEVIKGESADQSIDLLIPAKTRRQLADSPQLKIMLGRNAQSGQWHALGAANVDLLRVVRRTLDYQNTWVSGETDNLERLKLFTALLGHADERLHELAYLEIGRATYASIREVSGGLALEKVRSMHNNPLYYQWRGLDIMLLGLSGEEPDRLRVVSAMQTRQETSSELHLAAWATAFVEVRGHDGINELTDWYFREPTRSRRELRLIARALAGHANESADLQPLVVEAYRALLETHPRVAPDIAHDLIAWQRWDMFDQVQQLQPQLARQDPLGVYKVNLYLQRARAARREAQE